MTELIITRPDDWHLHLRDGKILEAVLPQTSATFARAMIMPNLVPPVATMQDAISYQKRILKALPKEHEFEPIMSLYLTQDTKWPDVAEAFDKGIIKAVKFYPAGATTNSQKGVSDIQLLYPLLEKMADRHIPLLIHGEVTDHNIDIFDREAVFIENILDPIRKNIPSLKITMEHITTRQAVDYVQSASENLAATITTHHLVINRNAYLVGGIKPHYYCLPIAKREGHRLALVKAATSGDKRFFLGTDSAPHTDAKKLQPCGCAGIFSSNITMNILAHVFEKEKALHHLEAFTSLYGAQYYGLPLNHSKIRLIKKNTPIQFDKILSTEAGDITVFDPGFDIFWYVE